MKTQKTSIRIIKRDERESASRATPSRTIKDDGSSDSARSLSSTVAGWVRESQHRRHAALSVAKSLLPLTNSIEE